MSDLLTYAPLLALLVEVALGAAGAGLWLRRPQDAWAGLGAVGRRWLGLAALWCVAMAVVGVAAVAFGRMRAEFAEALGWQFAFRAVLALAVIPVVLATEQCAGAGGKRLFRSQGVALVGGVALVIGLSHGWMAFAGQFVTIELGMALSEVSQSPGAFALLGMGALLAAAAEEVLYRGALQGGLAALCAEKKWRGDWVIPAQALVFALAHTGMVQPFGVKEVQIVLVGVVLGAVRRDQGLGAAIAVHAALNAYTMAISAAQWGGA